MLSSESTPKLLTPLSQTQNGIRHKSHCLWQRICINKRESCSTSFCKNCYSLTTVQDGATNSASSAETRCNFYKKPFFQWTTPAMPKSSKGTS